MKLKTFVILAVVCGLLAAASYMMLKPEKKRQANRTGEILLTDLPVNDITQILIQTPKEKISLEKGESVWELEERFGYPADFKKISDLAKKVRDMKIGRSFKATDDVLSRLGLLPPDKKEMPESQLGSQVIFKDKSGKIIGDLILGKARESDTGRGGHYVMPVGDENVYMVDADFKNMDKTPADWLDTSLLDIKADDVSSVTGTMPDGTAFYTVKRPEKGKAPEFVDIPEGKTIIASKLTSLVGALSGLNIEDVADPNLGDEKTGLAEGKCYKFRQFNGTIITLCTGKAAEGDDNKYYVKMSAGYEAPEVAEVPEAATPETANAAGDAAATPEVNTPVPVPPEPQLEPSPESSPDATKSPKAEEKKEDPARIKAEADKLNEKIGKWVFEMPKWKVDRLVADVEDFFEKPKEETAASTPPGQTAPKIPLMGD